MSIPREHRLRKHAEFEVVYRCGQRHFSSLFTAFYLLRPELQDPNPAAPELNRKALRPRVGITVGRALGKSTVRNRIKRRVRAAVTRNLERLTRPLDVVFNPKKAALDAEFQQLSAEVARAFDVVEQKAAPGKENSSRGPRRQRQPAKPERLAARKS
jgi:ribonuclease P protein component